MGRGGAKISESEKSALVSKPFILAFKSATVQSPKGLLDKHIYKKKIPQYILKLVTFEK